MADRFLSPASRPWRLFLLESRSQLRRLALLLACATPLLLLWLLSESAMLSFPTGFFDRQFTALLLFAGLIQVHYNFSAAQSAFDAAQYLMLPVSLPAKYAVRLVWVLVLTPAVTAAFFVAWVPVSQQLCLWLVQAQQHDGLAPNWAAVLTVYVLSMALVIPGALFFRNGGVIRSVIIYAVLYLLLSLLISISGIQPAVVSRFDNIGAGLEWYARLHPLPFHVVALLVVSPLFIVSGYYLFRDKRLL